MQHQTRSDLLLLTTTIVWGSTFAMMKILLDTLPPFTMLSFRFLLATLALWPWAVRHLRPLRKEDWRWGGMVGFFLFLTYGVQIIGLGFTTASRAGFITGLFVILVPLFSAILWRRWPSKLSLMGASVAAVGLSLLFRSPHSIPGASLSGDLLCLLAAGFAAVQILLIGEGANRWHPLALTWIQVSVVAGISTLLALILETPLVWPSGNGWLLLGYLALLATVFPFVVQVYAQKWTTPTKVAILYSLEPVFGAVIAWVLLGDSLGTWGWFGSGLILVGTMVSRLPDKAKTNLAQSA